jgi:hypothetical protein
MSLRQNSIFRKVFLLTLIVLGNNNCGSFRAGEFKNSFDNSSESPPEAVDQILAPTCDRTFQFQDLSSLPYAIDLPIYSIGRDQSNTTQVLRSLDGGLSFNPINLPQGNCKYRQQGLNELTAQCSVATATNGDNMIYEFHLSQNRGSNWKLLGRGEFGAHADYAYDPQGFLYITTSRFLKTILVPTADPNVQADYNQRQFEVSRFDQNGTYEVLDQFLPGEYTRTGGSSVTRTPNGNLYAVGYGSTYDPATGRNHITHLIRRSVDNGMSWTTILSRPLPLLSARNSAQVISNRQGDVYQLFDYEDPNGTRFFEIRVLRNGSSEWVDLPGVGSSVENRPTHFLNVDENGNLYLLSSDLSSGTPELKISIFYRDGRPPLKYTYLRPPRTRSSSTYFHLLPIGHVVISASAYDMDSSGTAVSVELIPIRLPCTVK